MALAGHDLLEARVRPNDLVGAGVQPSSAASIKIWVIALMSSSSACVIRCEKSITAAIRSPRAKASALVRSSWT